MLNKQINREKSEFSFHILLHISWFIYMYISHKICIYWFSNLNKIWIFYLSIRRHLVQRMSNDVVPANQTAQISLHRNRNSINNHKNLNIEQNRELLKTFTSADKSTREKYKKKISNTKPVNILYLSLCILNDILNHIRYHILKWNDI